ncbi:glycosyltransferase WbuB [Rhodoplanes elegans]|uniref:Glycosyltransferase WbuB n=1 Tax=Rhodoplanes elegans TaxID=29408 RepID=A0A327KM84_9BRAD|nr:glycosyltransferase family 4 protein [Rhodoplanes elegans]MBK5959735.1 glycosyltransferase WbuB [Rhodoplanes elegans]RAI39411.1 glycosyltransferase WbuB [Rhodoplanes elegans]
MKLLLLTFYYPPDLSAGSFRAAALVEALQQRAGPGLEIDVLTTLPNRYQSHAQAAEAHEQIGPVSITRIALPRHSSGLADQAAAFLQFARRVLMRRGPRYDVVVATSSRLMTAALGAVMARRSRAPLYLDIRDLFTDTMADVFSGSALAAALPVLERVERWTFRSAAHINMVSPGFREHLEKVVPGGSFSYFTNGIDTDFLDADFTRPEPAEARPLQILYAGNIGEGQGLHRILPEAARRLGDAVQFVVVGDGGRRKALEAEIADLPSGRVVLRDPVPRAQLHALYRDADMLLVHLNDYRAFKKVLPSKLFEYAATGKRILAGVSGYAEQFVRDEIPGAEVFFPCDVDGLAASIERLSGLPATIDRSAFVATHARTRIMDRMAADVLSRVPGGDGDARHASTGAGPGAVPGRAEH